MSLCKRILFFTLLGLPYSSSAASGWLKGISLSCGYSFSRQDEKVFQFKTPFSAYGIHAAYLGLNYQADLTQRLAFSTGVQLSERGHQVEMTLPFPFKPVSSLQVKYNYRMSYAEFPTGLVWYNSRAAWYALATPAYLLDASYTYSETYLDPKTGTPLPKSPYYKTVVRSVPWFRNFDLGLRVGFTKPLCSFLDLEVMVQKNVVRPVRLNTEDIHYNQSVFVGLRYYLGARPQKQINRKQIE